MARETQSISSTYTSQIVGSDDYGGSAVFRTVNLKPNKDLGVTSYDNAELTMVMDSVYHYAQQEVSFLRPLLKRSSTINSMFVTQKIFGKMNLVAKVEESPKTPLQTPTNSSRAYAAQAWHQGFQIDRDVARVISYSLSAHAQLELAKAAGRAIDSGIVHALTTDTLIYSSSAAKSFDGVKTTSTKALPDAQLHIHATVAASAIVPQDITSDLFDDIIELFENDSIAVQDLCVIGTPSLRRKLKKISNFRDREKTIAMEGPENRRMLEWLDLKFVILGPETKLNYETLIDDKYVDADGGQPVTSSTSGAVQVGTKASESENGDFEFCIVTDFDGLQWGDWTDANEMRASERDDFSYTAQTYFKMGFGGMRIDDSKVRIVAYKA